MTTSLPIGDLRLVSQRISDPVAISAGELVAALGAVQAQDYRAALWAIGLRLRDFTEAQVERALAGHTIVRTWPLRGTLHFVAAADVRWMLALLAPRTMAAASGRHRQLGLGSDDFARSREILAGVLRGDRRMSRGEVLGALEEGGVSAAGQRGIHILARLCQEGLLCLGPLHGRQQAFVLLEEWVPPGRVLDRDEALAELAGRYFAGHGPATLQDFVWWTGLKVADARAALEMAATSLASVTQDGTVYWMSREVLATGVPLRARSRVALLPAFDEYLLGYRDRSAVLARAAGAKLAPFANGRFHPIIVVGGRVAGTWRRVVDKGTVRVEASPFRPLTKAANAALRAAAERYVGFLGGVAAVANH